MLVKLDEIAKRLEDLGAVGVLNTETRIVGTSWRELLIGAWKSVDIWNDGDANLYIRIGHPLDTLPWDVNEAPIKKSEHIKLDMDVRKWQIDPVTREGGPPSIWAICESGTASVRVFKFI